MAGDNANGSEPTAEEITEMIREVRERVRARHPAGELGATGATLPDLLPVLHARDAAEAKVAAIGQVNPRRPGLLNDAIQAVKRLVARALDWHVRDQVEFNRGAIACMNAVLEALNENNRALLQLAGHFQGRAEELRGAIQEAQFPQAAKDLREHWAQWRVEWEEKLAKSEIYLLRSVSELNGAFQHRVAGTEASFRETAERQSSSFRETAGEQYERFRGELQRQHAEFNGLLAESAREIQARLWSDLKNIRLEYEKLIHEELRLIRQRSALGPGSAAAGSTRGPKLDWMRFAERFRGSEEEIRRRARRYVEKFREAGLVLDLGCGRGEFLEVMREAGLPARGVDLSAESVALVRAKGLEAVEADLFEHLVQLPENSVSGIYCAQVVEHLPPERLPDLAALAAAKLRDGGVLAIETPNPECLAIFSTHFYIDPTHTRPIPPVLLAFYLEEAGFGQIEVERLYPAVETMPSLSTLPEEFRNSFFGGLDYSVVARKL